MISNRTLPNLVLPNLNQNLTYPNITLTEPNLALPNSNQNLTYPNLTLLNLT